jgi:hypothetical protein
MQVLATVLVAVGFCLACASVAGLGWALWSGLMGQGWPVALPPPLATIIAGIAGVAAVMAGKRMLG